MKNGQMAVVIILTALVGNMAFAWCYEDSFLGGHIPFLITFLTPLITCWMGYRGGRNQEHQDNLEAGLFTKAN